MILLVRILVALAIGLVVGTFGFVAIFFLFAHFGSCPPEVHTCDLPMMGGFGLGLIAGPVIAFIATWASFRRLGRALGEARPQP